MIYTSYFDMLNSLPDNYFPISISRIPPEWYTGEEQKELAPGKDLLKGYRHGIYSAEQYTNIYKKQVLDKYTTTQIINSLYELIPCWFKSKLNSYNCVWYKNPEYHIVLLCYEKTSEFCHRNLVAKWLNDANISCSEIKHNFD